MLESPILPCEVLKAYRDAKKIHLHAYWPSFYSVQNQSCVQNLQVLLCIESQSLRKISHEHT